MSERDSFVCLHCGTPRLNGVCPRCGRIESTVALPGEPSGESDPEEDTAPHGTSRSTVRTLDDLPFPAAGAAPEKQPSVRTLDDLPFPAAGAASEKATLVPSINFRPGRSSTAGPTPALRPPLIEHFTRGHGDIRSEPVAEELPTSFPSRATKQALEPKPPSFPHPALPFPPPLASGPARAALPAQPFDEPPRPKVGLIDSNQFSELMPTDEKFSLLEQPKPDDNLTDSILPDSILGIPTTPKGLMALAGIFLTAILVVFMLATNARSLFPPPKDEVKLPTALHDKPSPKRPALVAAIDQMDEFASHAQGVLLDDHESATTTLQTLIHRLDDLDHFISELKPGLSSEEVRVASAMINPSTQLRAFIDSFNTRLPDLDGTYAKVAREQIQEARVLLTGNRSPTPLRGK